MYCETQKPKMQEDPAKSRNGSTSSKNYYPTVEELVQANTEELKCLISEKLTKVSLLCLLRKTVSQLKQAKKTTCHCRQFNDKLYHLSETFKARKPDETFTVTTALPENKIWADIVNKTLDEHAYDNSASKAILLYNIAGTSAAISETSAKASVERVFSKIKLNSGCIRAVSWLGKLNSTNARPRPIEVQLNNVFVQVNDNVKGQTSKGNQNFHKTKAAVETNAKGEITS